MSKPNHFFHKLLKPFITREEKSEDDIQNMATQERRTFSYETLVAATNNFHAVNKLGEGGFGPVFKGKLNDGREIAVKKLSRGSNQGKTQFVTEAKLLTRVQHRNVVNLFGYCIHGREKLLVYEYVPRESLDKFLFRSNKREDLDWKRRLDIINGVARGLLYLHEDSHNCIIHRDIKAANILLDEKWVPKIADFGLARLFPEDETHVNTHVAGTHGYMAPEYLMHGHLSVKADVYSYGVLMLELITGHRNSSSDSAFNGDNLLNWAYRLYKKGKGLEMVDPTMASLVDEQVEICIRVSLLCVQGDPQFRPTMGRVVLMLSKKPPSHMEEPTRPGVPGSRYRRILPRTRTPFITTTTTDDDNDSCASHIDSSYFDTNTTNVTTSTNSTGSASAQVDSRGKRPMLP